MKRASLTAFVVAIVVGLACSHHPQDIDPNDARIETLRASAFGTRQIGGFPHSFATPECGPGDGPGFSIYLHDTRREKVTSNDSYIRLTIYNDAKVLEGASLEWGASRGPGVGEWCVKGTCAAIREGQVDIGTVNTETIDGEIDLLFTNTIRLRQRFHARRLHTVLICT
jgi:hypothetical protein